MIKNIFIALLLTGVVSLTTQCRQTKSAESATSADNENNKQVQASDTSLYAMLASTNASMSLQDSLMIRFTVTNPTKEAQRFTTYHTPFEGFISKFLTVTDSNGTEMDYIGAMAKRIMPPPAETYHTLAGGQSESVSFDLKKGYRIEHAGTYTLQYNGENISGVANGKAIQITIVQ